MEKKLRVLGIDIAKQVLHLVGLDAHGTIVVHRRLYRKQVMAFIAQLPPPTCMGMEACGGAHYGVRRLRGHGHEVTLMAPQFVTPQRKAHTNDLRDAEAIAEAVTRPTMRFVAVKSVEQHDLQALHRAGADEGDTDGAAQCNTGTAACIWYQRAQRRRDLAPAANRAIATSGNGWATELGVVKVVPFVL